MLVIQLDSTGWIYFGVCCQVMVGIDQDLHDEPKLLGSDLSC